MSTVQTHLAPTEMTSSPTTSSAADAAVATAPTRKFTEDEINQSICKADYEPLRDKKVFNKAGTLIRRCKTHGGGATHGKCPLDCGIYYANYGIWKTDYVIFYKHVKAQQNAGKKSASPEKAAAVSKSVDETLEDIDEDEDDEYTDDTANDEFLDGTAEDEEGDDRLTRVSPHIAAHLDKQKQQNKRDRGNESDASTSSSTTRSSKKQTTARPDTHGDRLIISTHNGVSGGGKAAPAALLKVVSAASPRSAANPSSGTLPMKNVASSDASQVMKNVHSFTGMIEGLVQENGELKKTVNTLTAEKDNLALEVSRLKAIAEEKKGEHNILAAWEAASKTLMKSLQATRVKAFPPIAIEQEDEA
jgi:regulator of replication initiation timing